MDTEGEVREVADSGGVAAQGWNRVTGGQGQMGEDLGDHRGIFGWGRW